MKKIKVTVNDSSPGRQILLFPSAEAAYVWLTSVDEKPDIHNDISGVERIDLVPGEFIEAEWMGCEYAHDRGFNARVDQVRLAKAHQPQNASGLLVSVHFGWTTECDLPFHDYDDDDIVVRRLSPGEHRIDLSILFKDDKQEP